MKKLNQNDGYTIVEIIIAIGVLSILIMTLLPQFRMVEQKIRNEFNISIERTALTHLYRTVTIKLKSITWPYWSDEPEIINSNNAITMTWCDRKNIKEVYTISKKDNSITVSGEEINRTYTFTEIKTFDFIMSENNKSPYIQLETSHFNIKIPLIFGSSVLASYEK